MKITLVLINKTEPVFLEQGIQMYTQRLQKYTLFEIVTLPALKNTKNLTFEQIKTEEGKMLLKFFEAKTPTGLHVILLDDKGKQPTSEQLAEKIEQYNMRNIKQLYFVVGGAFGFSSAVYNFAHEKLSLSLLTFSHQLVRLIFVEQLYRAFSILNNEPYHHA